LRVNILCRNYQEDRILPRMARYLAAGLGWRLTAKPDLNCDALYLMGYFEAQLLKGWPKIPVVSYFTHREEAPAGNAKAKLWDAVAGKVALRVAMSRIYGKSLEQFGPVAQPPLPVEKMFNLGPASSPKGRGGRMVVGLSGYTYSNKRKGQDIVDALLKSKIAGHVEWRASGRGWSIPTKRYAWKDMPSFYQGLDVLVCPSRVEGGPLPVLEALACGVQVVVPAGVGIIDELPKVRGIWRYKRGDGAGLIAALEQAIQMKDADRQGLRKAVQGHTVENFVAGHAEAMAMLFGQVDGGIAETANGQVGTDSERAIEIAPMEPVEMKTGSKRGIYCVAFGDPARKCALRLMKSAKKYMPDIPIMLCAAKKIGPEDLLVTQPDSDIGGRRAKLKAYELTPKEWQSVLYLDADTVVTAPITYYFELIEDGWEFVICKDPHLMDTMHSFRRKNNDAELVGTQEAVKTLHTLQWNGGVWAFGRSPRIAAFFQRWKKEWEVHAQRDQGALVRAMYAEPLKIMLLGNQWNTFDKYCKGIETAGLMHYPGDARRWKGMEPGRIDGKAAWDMVKRVEKGL